MLERDATPLFVIKDMSPYLSNDLESGFIAPEVRAPALPNKAMFRTLCNAEDVANPNVDLCPGFVFEGAPRNLCSRLPLRDA
jgi:hypothetical protein